MKNLKRVLSMALATVMLMGTMAIANAADFTDVDDIQNTDAVNFMVALGIINGKDDGSFDPTATVTRAEMAKMITVALNGGKDPVLGTNSVSYTDTANHWARNYIEYCTNLGIISGRGNGIFDPDKGVTGSEAAKMILVAMGYQSDWFHFTGADWEINVNIQANDATVTNEEGETSVSGLYKGLPKNFDPSAPLSRDNAAQIINNGIKADMMVRGQITVTGNGTEYSYTKRAGTTILNSKFDVIMEYGILDGVTYNKDDEDFTYTVSGTDIPNSPYTFSGDVSGLFMQQVEVVLTGDGETVLGISAYDSAILASGIVSDLKVVEKNDAPTEKLKVGKTTVTTDETNAGNLGIVTFLGNETTLTVDSHSALKDYWTVNVIDNDNDKKADIIVAHPVYVEKVNSVSRTGISANGTYKFEDDTIADGLKKGDYVVITKSANTANGKNVIEKAEITTGTIRAEKAASGSTPKQVQVGSTWYKLDGSVLSADVRGNKYDMVIVNGYVLKADKASDNASADIADTVLVVKADDPGEEDTIGEGSQRVQLLFADGSKKIVTVAKINKKAKTENGETTYPLSAVASDNRADKGDLFTYAINKDGDYELSTIVAGDFDGNKTGASTGSYSKGKVTIGGENFRFADDAVIFVMAKDDTTKVVTGKDVNGWDSIAFASKTTLYANKDNGFLYTAMGLIDLGTNEIPGLAGDTLYGVLVENAIRATDEDGKKTVELTIWTGSENIEVFTRQSLTVTDYKAGTIISYKEESGSEIAGVAKETFESGAVKAYAGGSDIEIWDTAANTAYKLDDDVIILGINKGDNNTYEGVEGAEIRLADQAETDGALVVDTWNINVMHKSTISVDGGNTTKTIKVIVVETDNDFGTTVEVAGSAPAAE